MITVIIAVMVMIVLCLATIACIAVVFPGLITGMVVFAIKLTVGVWLIGYFAERKAKS